MASVTPTGDQNYWSQGLPFPLPNNSVDTGSLKWWSKGLPVSAVVLLGVAGGPAGATITQRIDISIAIDL